MPKLDFTWGTGLQRVLYAFYWIFSLGLRYRRGGTRYHGDCRTSAQPGAAVPGSMPFGDPTLITGAAVTDSLSLLLRNSPLLAGHARLYGYLHGCTIGFGECPGGPAS